MPTLAHKVPTMAGVAYKRGGRAGGGVYSDRTEFRVCSRGMGKGLGGA